MQSGARVTRVSTTAGSPIVSRPAVATSPSVVGTPAAYPATPTVYPATPTVYPPPSRDYSTAPVASRSQPYVPQVKARASSRSVIFVAKNWIVVRVAASQDAHIVASVGPEARVQLGEVRGSWRRIRSRDIVGWVDMRRANFAEARGSTRANGFAVR